MVWYNYMFTSQDQGSYPEVTQVLGKSLKRLILPVMTLPPIDKEAKKGWYTILLTYSLQLGGPHCYTYLHCSSGERCDISTCKKTQPEKSITVLELSLPKMRHSHIHQYLEGIIGSVKCHSFYEGFPRTIIPSDLSLLEPTWYFGSCLWLTLCCMSMLDNEEKRMNLIPKNESNSHNLVRQVDIKTEFFFIRCWLPMEE